MGTLIENRPQTYYIYERTKQRLILTAKLTTKTYFLQSLLMLFFRSYSWVRCIRCFKFDSSEINSCCEESSVKIK